MNRDTRMDAMEDVTPLCGASTQLNRLTESDLGPFFLMFCLFIAGFVLFAGVMVFVVLGGRLAFALFVLFPIVVVVGEARKRRALKNHRGGSRGRLWNETDKWAIVLGWCFPRKHREAMVGDILEDCHEMRERGLNERRIRTHVLWQWLMSIVTLIPTYFICAIRRLFGAK